MAKRNQHVVPHNGGLGRPGVQVVGSAHLGFTPLSVRLPTLRGRLSGINAANCSSIARMGVSGIVPRTVTTRFRRGGSWASDVFRQDGLFGIFHTAHSADSTSACSKHCSHCLSPACRRVAACSQCCFSSNPTPPISDVAFPDVVQIFPRLKLHRARSWFPRRVAGRRDS